MKELRFHIFRILALLLFSICSIGGELYAATRIYGTVKDSMTGETLPYVSVYLKNTTDGCQTDKDGNFSFISPETQATLVVSYMGYAEQRLSINDKTHYPLHIMLSPLTYRY